jgi:hypothetical protein
MQAWMLQLGPVVLAQHKSAGYVESWDPFLKSIFMSGEFDPIPDIGTVPTTGPCAMLWATFCSWSYCDKCLRVRTERPRKSINGPEGLLAPVRECAVGYRRSCAKQPHDFLSPMCPRPEEGLAGEPFDVAECYVTPRREDYPAYDGSRFVLGAQGTPLYALSPEETRALQVVRLFCDFKRQRGMKGTAPMSNTKKLSVVRAEWSRLSVRTSLPTERAKAAYDFLTANNPTYRSFVQRHEAFLHGNPGNYTIPTAELLLRMDGVEVACRPHLYPHHAYGDSDCRSRLLGLHLLEHQQVFCYYLSFPIK